MDKQLIQNRLTAAQVDRGMEFVVLYRKWDGSGENREALEFLDEYRDYWSMNRARNYWDDMGYRAKRVFDLTYNESHDMA